MQTTPLENLDTADLASAVAGDGYVCIPDFIAADDLDPLIEGLIKAPSWALTRLKDGVEDYVTAERIRTMTERNRSRLSQEIYAVARAGHQYVYQRLPIDMAAETGGQEEHPAVVLHGVMNSAPIIDLARAVSGDSAISRVMCEGRYFHTNQFYMRQRGTDADAGNRLGYELMLTPNWLPDFGGYLQFHDDKDDITHALMARRNVLVLYDAARPVSVSAIAPFCDRVRLSVAGWFAV